MTDATQEQQTRKGTVEVEEPSRAQQVAVRRVAEAKATVPELTVRTDVDVSAALAVSSDLDALVVRAAALALRALPHANGAYRDGRFERYSRVNVGLAVAAAQGTLAYPTVYDADAKPVAQIAAEAAALADQVRAGTVSGTDAGSTFTVTTAAGSAVDALEPILVAPQAAGLGVGAVRDAIVAVDGAPAVRPVVTLTLVADHRALHAADAAALLAKIAELLRAGDALA